MRPFPPPSALTALLLLSACSLGTGPNEQQLETLEERRAIWEASGVADYSYTVAVYSMVIGGRPIAVEVRGGTPTSVRYTDTGDEVAAPEGSFVARFDTIDELFDVVEEQIQNRADQVSATYDVVLGYPVYAEFNPTLGAVDDEFSFLVSNFERATAP